MIRGISFEIPNKHGRLLGEILKPFETDEYNWLVGGEEAYFIVDGQFEETLFAGAGEIWDGITLKKLLEENEYYIIFQDLKAFPQGKDIVEVKTYEEFLNSDCQLVLLVVDSCFVSIYCKNNKLIEDLFKNAQHRGYDHVRYITDANDTRTGLSVW